MSVSRLLPGRRPAALLALAALTLAAGAVGWWATRPRDALAYDFAPGRRLVYELEYVSVSASDFTRVLANSPGEGEPAAGLSRSFRTSIGGQWEVTVAAREGDRYLLAYRLHDPKVRLASDGEPDLDRARALRADLARTLFAEVDRRGRVHAVRLGRSRSGLSSSLVRTLLAATQVVLPDSGSPPGWEAEEDDPNGAHVARYRAEPGQGVRTLRKARLRYHPAEAQDPGHEFTAPLVVSPSGELTAEVDVRAGHLVSVRGTESTTLLVQDRVVARAESTIRLRLLRAESLGEGQEQALNARRLAGATAVPVALSARESEQASEELLHRTELGEATADSLLAELANAEKQSGDADGTTLALKLKALVYLHPEHSDALARRLTGASPESVPMRLLTQALADSGQPKAQSALAAVLRARDRDLPALLYLIPALGMARAPTRQSEEALARLAADDRAEVRSTAQLALGVMARTLARGDPARADAIVRRALARLGKARSADDRQQALLVLGNTGSPLALPAIRGHLSDPEPEVRGAAAAALRWLEGPEAESALCRSLTADADDTVRLEAAHAFEFRRMTARALAAHRRAFAADASVSVRLAVLKNLARVRHDFPEAEATIQKAAGDPVTEVKQAATELLEGEGP